MFGALRFYRQWAFIYKIYICHTPMKKNFRPKLTVIKGNSKFMGVFWNNRIIVLELQDTLEVIILFVKVSRLC